MFARSATRSPISLLLAANSLSLSLSLSRELASNGVDEHVRQNAASPHLLLSPLSAMTMLSLPFLNLNCPHRLHRSWARRITLLSHSLRRLESGRCRKLLFGQEKQHKERGSCFVRLLLCRSSIASTTTEKHRKRWREGGIAAVVGHAVKVRKLAQSAPTHAPGGQGARQEDAC